MNAVNGTVLCIAIVIGAWSCSAQNEAIPFNQIERDAVSPTIPIARDVGEMRGNFTSSIALSGPALLSFTADQKPVDAKPKSANSRLIGPRFYLINGLHLGMAAFDVAMTQNCIADHHCQEGNPLMPSGLAGQLSVNFAVVGFSSFVSYRLRQQHSTVWWLPPAIGVTAHGIGAATGIAHR